MTAVPADDLFDDDEDEFMDTALDRLFDLYCLPALTVFVGSAALALSSLCGLIAVWSVKQIGAMLGLF